MAKVSLGSKYFRHLDNGSLEVIRIIGYSDTETVKIKFEDGSKAKIKITELLKFYFKLNPDGIVTISNVRICVDDSHNFFDTVVTLHNYNDIKKDSNAAPYLICRQNISDVFTNMQNTNGIQYMGCCISKDNIPEGVPFEGLLMCDNIEEFDVVEVYLTDKLSDILECVKSKPYDRNLESLFEKSIEKFSIEDRKELRKVGCNCGYVRKLEDLLTINNFILDFDACFGTIKVDLNFNINNNQLDVFQLALIEDVFNTTFESHYIIKYDRDIDLSNIKYGRYILLKDKSETTYVLSYVSDIEINTLNIAYDKLMALTKDSIKVKYGI